MVKLYKIKFIKEFDKKKIGDTANCSKKSADAFIKNGYAEYVKEPENKLIPKKKIKKKKIQIEPTTKEILLQEKSTQELEDFKENEINWTEEIYWDSWDKIKGHIKKLLGNREPYIKDEPIKWFLLSHNKDTIKGRPQMIESMKMKMPLIRQAVKKIKDKETKEEIEIQSFYFFDEKFDKRYDGFQKDAFALDFYKYIVETPDDKRFYLLTKEKLPNETCTFKGMAVELSDWNELSRTMKLPSLSRIFFVKEFKPAIKIMPKEDLIKFTQTNSITEEDWLNYLAIHKLGTINNFPAEMELLRSAFILSSKVDGWPLHLGVIGQAGTRKTMGHGESLAFKFTESEEDIMIDSGNSRLKGLIPSFKGTITKEGFLINSERIGIIDEIGKMVEDELNKHDQSAVNVLGKINPILEHKHRKVTSGNTDDCSSTATAKFLFLTNPISSKLTIYDHLTVLDPTTMSRILWWVQDEDEVKFVLSDEGILRNSPQDTNETKVTHKSVANPPDTFTSIYTCYIENRKKGIFLGKSWGKVCSSNICNRDDFLSLFDTCYSFVCDIKDSDVLKLANTITTLAKEPMKTSVWKPRSYHHVKLLVDGLCKHRCLFKDYDSSFIAKQEDYDLAERILIRMVKGWDTNLAPKENWNGF